MTQGILMTAALVFILNLISNCLGTLKTIFISKKAGKISYIITGIDALLFSVVLKGIASSNSLITIIAYTLGKVVGAILADYIEECLALGLLEVNINANQEKAIKIADSLRSIGYSVNTIKSFGNLGKERFMVVVTIARKELSLLKEILKKYNIDNPTMTIKEIKNVQGNINTYAKK